MFKLKFKDRDLTEIVWGFFLLTGWVVALVLMLVHDTLTYYEMFMLGAIIVIGVWLFLILKHVLDIKYLPESQRKEKNGD